MLSPDVAVTQICFLTLFTWHRQRKEIDAKIVCDDRQGVQLECATHGLEVVGSIPPPYCWVGVNRMGPAETEGMDFPLCLFVTTR